MAEKVRPKQKKKSSEIESQLSESDSVQEIVLEKVHIEETPLSPFPSTAESPPSHKNIEETQINSVNASISTNSEEKQTNSISKVQSEQQSSPNLSKDVQKTIAQLKEAKKDPLAKLASQYEKLSELEKSILEIAKTILKKKKYSAELTADRIEMMSPLVEQLHSKCVAKLTYTKGFTREEIFAAIQNLKNEYWLVTEQRRTRYEILNSPILKNVIKFIHEHPGTHARDPAITEELGITRNPFIKHVMVLDAFGLIRTKKIGRTQNYFLIDVPETFDEFVVLFSNPLVVQIMILLMQESIGLSEIARRLGVYHGAIQYHIKNLISLNLIFKDGKSLSVNVDLLKEYNSLYKVPPFHLYF
ncbi:hypothetical protein [Candidatus Lokiarchaeum ossiferum]|uniref:hypothetical protein n=1 Tax=Candidatus Lokiarchaeum ossiferum TaxID=2951803 RepID=UPI00352FE4D6